MIKRLLIFVCMLTVLSVSAETVITMGYRTTAKLPYIEAAPSNAGLYYDLYSEAASRAGLSLDVVRVPKVRVEENLRRGLIDFYPGYSYTDERAEFAFWMRNGMIQRDIVVGRIEHHDELVAGDTGALVQGLSLGNPLKLEGFEVLEVAELGLDRAFQMLASERIDVYVAEESTIKYYIKSNSITNVELFDQYIDEVYYSHAGFSVQSPLFMVEPNPLYNPQQAQSPTNFPIALTSDSPAKRFNDALRQMSEDGTTKAILARYFD